MENTLNELSLVLFKFFVANPYAAAIQQENGIYLTKYFPFSSFVIENVIREKGSIGCYQQGYKNGLVKWICFDFDCKDKENPNISVLYNQYIISFLEVLDMYGISYLKEFSGRRGIHIWIIFNELISKEMAYEIVLKLKKCIFVNDKFLCDYNIDFFPATGSSKGNKVGKQVKLPLSTHKNGSQSFFFIDDFKKIDTQNMEFLSEQLSILKKYTLNNADIVCEKLGIQKFFTDELSLKYKRFMLVNDIILSVNDVINTLSKTKVFELIFHRLMFGSPYITDWFVILGTLSPIDINGQLLKSIFSKTLTYNEEMTNKNIEKWLKSYSPATFNHLYKIYNLNMEENIVGNKTGLEYLLSNLGLLDENTLIFLNKSNLNLNENILINDINFSVMKERKYLLYNDENIDISIMNDLNKISGYQISLLNKCILEIKNTGSTNFELGSFKKFNRHESPEKDRYLISLDVNERIITTHLSILLAYKFPNYLKSYSYNVIFNSKEDIFYNWFASWGNYLERIRMFFDVPYLANWGVMTLDVKNFYDSVDFLAVYKLLESKISNQDKNIFRFLISFNDNIMREINGTRKGVPQGPAYARIISEIFLSTVLNNLEYRENSKDLFLFRYVDDIIVFYPQEIDGNSLFNSIKSLLNENGLYLNILKSRNYGKINKISREDKRIILRENQFNYNLQISENNKLLVDNQKREIFKNLIKEEYNLNNVAYIFSKNIDLFYSKTFFLKFKSRVYSELYGRGSIFANFYRFVFNNNSILTKSILDNDFNAIPLNSINFKNCISQLYVAIQSNEISRDNLKELYYNFLLNLNLNDIDADEKTTIESILFWGKTNELY